MLLLYSFQKFIRVVENCETRSACSFRLQRLCPVERGEAILFPSLVVDLKNPIDRISHIVFVAAQPAISLPASPLVEVPARYPSARFLQKQKRRVHRARPYCALLCTRRGVSYSVSLLRASCQRRPPKPFNPLSCTYFSVRCRMTSERFVNAALGGLFQAGS